jgi:hypothetical protein
VFHSKLVHLARELVAELLEQIPAQKLVLKRAQHARFNFVAADGQMVVASSVIAGAEARFACSLFSGWAALSAAPMHRRLTGDVPWRPDDVDSEVATDLALWSEAEAQSVAIACSADVSCESATRE